jgi:hypothetical protein
MIDIGGKQITAASGALSFAGISFDSSGRAVGTTTQPGFNGSKNTSDVYQSQSGVAWPINSVQWTSGNHSNGVFTCPIAGVYLCSAAGIMTGYGQTSTHGYAGFSRNGVNEVYMHWNQSVTNAWTCGGTAQLFNCAAGDTLRFHVNGPPLSNYNTGSAYGAQTAPGYGWFNQQHHNIFIIRVS